MSQESFRENPKEYHPKETYYDILGINPDATQEEIKSAFRKRVQETHPDKPENKNKEEEFRQIEKAYRVLIDPIEKQRYDDSLNVSLGKERDKDNFFSGILMKEIDLIPKVLKTKKNKK